MENQPVIHGPPLCIAGAHRSGTSMVTRLLHACGLALGPESDLMPAQADNPDGFWENLHFVAINDEVLNQLGGAWDLPPPRCANHNHECLALAREKARLYLHQFNPGSIWGWKDPRNSLTLPFWQNLLPDLKVLLVVRSPLEAAYSMRKRNGHSYSFGLRLWEIYNRSLLRDAPDDKLLVTHYDSFFQDPELELHRIANFAGLSSSLIADTGKLVTGKKRHTRFTVEQLIGAGLAQEIVELYQQLLDRSKDADLRSSIAPPDQFLSGAASRINNPILDLEETRRELAWARGAEKKYRDEIARSEGRLRELEAHADRQENARSTLERELARLRERSERDLALARERVAQTTRQLQNERELLTRDLRKYLRAVDKLTWFMKETGSAATRLRASRRWKFANPFSALRKLFGGRELAGYGHLEKVVTDYLKWQSSHPEIDLTREKLHALEANPSSPIQQLPGWQGNLQGAKEPPIPQKAIEFPRYDTVDVSIVIPVFNQLRYTQACLASLQEHQADHKLEVIVVDDCSTDDTQNKLRHIPGIVYLRREKNEGFVASCNYGAGKARGKYLVFLNNDTLVTPGWLAALLDTFRWKPRAGLVGAKLVYPNGRLQEAGGIIWRDGSGWNRGKFDDARKPEYNYAREVDYCSGACLILPRKLFEEVGGFDLRYQPAYYEDADLAFKIRQLDFKVLYQPLCQIVHFEGATGGTDLTTGTKKYQDINRKSFMTKWAEVISTRPANGDVTAVDTLSSAQKRILVIDHHLPMTDRDAGSVRMFHILNILHQLGHRVIFLPSNLADIAPYGDQLRGRGVEVVTRPFFKHARAYLLAHGAMLDAVILSRCGIAREHISEVRQHAPRARLIFDTVDLHFLRLSREAELTQDFARRIAAHEMRQQELEVIRQSDETWVVSEVERELLRCESPGSSVEVVPTIAEIREPTTGFAERADLLFIGSFQHPPNIDAVLFFTNEIYPIVLRAMPLARFFIIGDKAPPEIISLASENIIVTGPVPDVWPYFEAIKLSVAPIRFGAGVKGKINQSMGFGVPVVATSLALEGMCLTDGDDVLAADEPEDFAHKLVELYQSEELWNRLSQNGIKKTAELFSPGAVGVRLSRLFSEEHFSSASERRRSMTPAR